MELTEEEKTLIYIALSNSLITYNSLLEENKFNIPGDKQVCIELIEKQENLLDRFHNEISKEDTIIPKPKWK